MKGDRDRVLAPHGHQWTVNTLRVYLLQQIRMERRVAFTRFKAMDRAAKLLASDISRRLDSLNHAREQAEAAQRTYLLREVHDRTNEEWVKWRNSVEQGLNVRLPREVFEKTLDEWSKWRGGVDQVMARAAERRTVIAALIVGALTFVGMVFNTIERFLGH